MRARQSVERPISSRNSSVRRCSDNRTKMARPPTSRRGSRRWTRRRVRRGSSRTPKGRLRGSMTTLTLSTVTTSATRHSTSCSGVPGTVRPGASSRPCTVKLRPQRPGQEQRRTTSGWRRRLCLTPLTTRRACHVSGSSRCLSPQPLPISSCTMS
jgi:hypothetical protein